MINISTEECCIGRGLAAIVSKTKEQNYLWYLLNNIKNQLNVLIAKVQFLGQLIKRH